MDIKRKGQVAKVQDAQVTFVVVQYLALRQKQMEAGQPKDLRGLALRQKQTEARQPKDLRRSDK